MKYNNYILLGIAFTALPVSIQAQTQPKDTTVNRTVIVEQQYNPDIMDAAKVNVLPKVEEPSVSKKEVEYATFTTPATSIPAGTIGAYTGKETQPGFIPGYVRLGYGNYGNLDVLANYLFRLSDRDKLNVNFKMDGMDGTLDMPFGDTRKWNAFYYRTRANVDYVHQFAKLDLNVAGNFGLSNFNYEPYGFKKQKFTSGDVHFGVKSTDETLPLQYRAETNLMLYGRQQCQLFGGVNETMVRTLATVSGSVSDEQTVAIGFAMNNLIYGNELKENKDRIKDIFKNRTTLDLNPYYELNNDSWRVHVGANVDLSFGNGKAVRVSPDVKAQYVFSDSYVLYAKAIGGRQLNDFRRLETYNPYLDPGQEVKDTYEQLNAGLGFKASPTPGLWFDIFGGYQNLKDDLYQSADAWEGGDGANYIGLGQTHTDNFYAGIKASYEYKDLFAISAGGTYYHWNADAQTTGSKSSDYNEALLMKPEFDLGIHTEIHPIAALWLNAGYQYTRRAERYTGLYAKSIPAVSNLSLGATYRIFKGISAYVKADNLLNKKYQYYLYYPVEGINFVGGLSFRF
ncbi:TonB-dependent receptor [Bacteroides fragilis]|uniref:TonB-denpendent receptor n=1 Tax=Bacteroides fragilis TaxID=817 RepID=A0A853PQ52_BACFG|nr:TonB-dependent receptor [Bacteroides fragilis]EYA36967.1 tonB dependent receptor family protein [Bacteroides fragilis str. 20793-3]MCS2359776.1 TonB-dependent receptor [Bacteroides fragilis]OCR27234.1 tonB-denpendent receptor [Bacteroides fragilis]PJY66060.1 hypothetical protein CQW35_02110 [Bacteroides fragilis]